MELENFIQKRLCTNTVPFFDPISKLKLQTFSADTAQKVVNVFGKDVIVNADSQDKGSRFV